MDQLDLLSHKESALQEKFHKLEEKKKALIEKGELFVDLRNIHKPKDISNLNSLKREVAYERNHQLLQELDIDIGKLHTMRLCPINAKLRELRENYIGS